MCGEGIRVLKRGMTPDLIEIQIEDWSKDYSFMPYGRTIAIYPKNRYNKKFRAEEDFKRHEEAERVFKNLVLGINTLADFNFTSKHNGISIPFQRFL